MRNGWRSRAIRRRIDAGECVCIFCFASDANYNISYTYSINISYNISYNINISYSINISIMVAPEGGGETDCHTSVADRRGRRSLHLWGLGGRRNGTSDERYILKC